MKKKLYRNTEDKMIAGVISGLAEYVEYDVTLLRLLAVLLIFLSGFFPGVVIYLVAWIIVPEKEVGGVRVHDVEVE